jgi:hypothetical protein
LIVTGGGPLAKAPLSPCRERESGRTRRRSPMASAGRSEPELGERRVGRESGVLAAEPCQHGLTDREPEVGLAQRSRSAWSYSAARNVGQ